MENCCSLAHITQAVSVHDDQNSLHRLMHFMSMTPRCANNLITMDFLAELSDNGGIDCQLQ